MLNGNNVSRVINYTYIEIQDAKNAKIYAFVTLMLTIPVFLLSSFYVHYSSLSFVETNV